MPPTRPYQERAAKRRRTNPADETRSGPQASQRTPPVLLGLSGLGQLTLEMIAAINTAVTQALRAAAATPHVQFVPDSQVPGGCSSVLPRIDSSTEVKPATEAAGAVQGTVQRMLDHVIGTQDNASISKNTFFSEAIPLSNLVPEKVKNQIWANEFIDFSLLLKSNISNTDDDQYTIKFETKKGGQPSVVLAPHAKRVTLHSIDQWTSAFQIYVAIYTEPATKDTPALMKYGSVIRELATLGANWQFYHANFRKLRQSQGIPWDQIHSELWLRSHSFRDKPTTHPKRAKHEGPNIPNGYCWKFHRGIHCPGCSFKHQCFRCGQSHPIVKCQQPKQSAGQGKKPNVSYGRSAPNTGSG